MNKRETRKAGLRLAVAMLDTATTGDVNEYLRQCGVRPDAKMAGRVLVELIRIKRHLEWEAAGRPEQFA
jgi:hypothetical protein